MAGFVIGLVLGAVIGLVIFGRDGAAIWITALGMAFAGLPIGALTWAIAETPTSPTFDTTYEKAARVGEVHVAVNAADSEAIRKVTEVLHKQGAGRVESQGRTATGRASQRM